MMRRRLVVSGWRLVVKKMLVFTTNLQPPTSNLINDV
jgi:hypothetical protein